MLIWRCQSLLSIPVTFHLRINLGSSKGVEALHDLTPTNFPAFISSHFPSQELQPHWLPCCSLSAKSTCCSLCLEAFPVAATWPARSSASLLLSHHCARETTPNHPACYFSIYPLTLLCYSSYDLLLLNTRYIYLFTHVLSVSCYWTANPSEAGIFPLFSTAISSEPRSVSGIEWGLNQHVLLSTYVTGTLQVCFHFVLSIYYSQYYYAFVL